MLHPAANSLCFCLQELNAAVRAMCKSGRLHVLSFSEVGASSSPLCAVRSSRPRV